MKHFIILIFLTFSIQACGNVKLNQDLFQAVKGNDIEKVKKLLEQGASANAMDSRQYSILHEAVFNDSVEIAKLLIKNGANLNGVSKKVHPPIIFAVSGGKYEIVKLLIESGVDINFKDVFDKQNLLNITIFSISSRRVDNINNYNYRKDYEPYLNIVQYLIDKKIKVQDSIKNYSPLIAAVRIFKSDYCGTNDMKLIQLLMKYCVDVDSKSSGSTIDLVHLIDINAKDIEGKTALDYAIEGDKGNILIQYLKTHGAKSGKEVK